jgi:hypothetical protein
MDDLAMQHDDMLAGTELTPQLLFPSSLGTERAETTDEILEIDMS